MVDLLALLQNHSVVQHLWAVLVPMRDVAYWQEGVWLLSLIILQIAVFELISLETSKALWQKNQSLYKRGIWMNLVNKVCLALPSYVLSLAYFTRELPSQEEQQHGQDGTSRFLVLTIIRQILQVAALHQTSRT